MDKVPYMFEMAGLSLVGFLASVVALVMASFFLGFVIWKRIQLKRISKSSNDQLATFVSMVGDCTNTDWQLSARELLRRQGEGIECVVESLCKHGYGGDIDEFGSAALTFLAKEITNTSVVTEAFYRKLMPLIRVDTSKVVFPQRKTLLCLVFEILIPRLFSTQLEEILTSPIQYIDIFGYAAEEYWKRIGDNRVSYDVAYQWFMDQNWFNGDSAQLEKAQIFLMEAPPEFLKWCIASPAGRSPQLLRSVIRFLFTSDAITLDELIKIIDNKLYPASVRRVASRAADKLLDAETESELYDRLDGAAVDERSRGLIERALTRKEKSVFRSAKDALIA